MTCSPLKVDGFVATPAGCALQWQKWDELYIVYQPSSAETHVFNETTVAIVRGLECGPLPTEALKVWTETALGVDQGDLAADDFAFATMRLEELGLIERLDDASAVQ
ncbi:HPr-rel-A system PqqD family peptide chaperone [Propionivibrio sp.]|uniref:HPr-rel-A system PqqD family peptide chaperone n=1 Tax=Propionivibrio sp. TaxID=2212460 RepID=UPI003BF01DBC